MSLSVGQQIRGARAELTRLHALAPTHPLSFQHPTIKHLTVFLLSVWATLKSSLSLDVIFFFFLSPAALLSSSAFQTAQRCSGSVAVQPALY